MDQLFLKSNVGNWNIFVDDELFIKNTLMFIKILAYRVIKSI